MTVDNRLMKQIEEETRKGFLGKEELVKNMVLCLSAGLHVLIEDVAGVGKTTLVKCLSRASGLDYGRIQFTPDLLPGDITGQNIWEPVKREFIYKEGAVVRDFVLADEINRASARTQSALLEAMQDGSVTVDGETRKLSDLFFVAATQNPSYYAGTFKLPESQLDRFGAFLTPGYPDSEREVEILLQYKNRNPEDNISQVAEREDLIRLRKIIQDIEIKDNVARYLVQSVHETRNSPHLKAGVSTRGTQHLLRASQAHALYEGRSFVIPEDVKYSASFVLPHKITLSPEARTQQMDEKSVINGIFDKLEIPVTVS